MDSNTSFNLTNGTGYRSMEDNIYFTIYNGILAVTTVVIMVSMGSSITTTALKTTLKRPVGPVLGLVCQVLIMPAVCSGYAILLGLEDNIAIGMVLIGSCPGGSISNMIAFWAKADITLSITMTTISTTLAIGTLPLNMYLYSSRFTTEESKIPYSTMVFTVLYVWAAVFVGCIMGRCFPKAVPYFTKIGSVVTIVLLSIAGVIQGKIYPEIFNLSWQTWLGGVTMPVIGFIIGFTLAVIFCQDQSKRMAIGLETGIQNVALALAVMALSFPSSWEASYYSQYILLYGAWQFIFGMVAIFGIWIYNFIRYRETPCALARAQEAQQLEDKDAVEPLNGDVEKNIKDLEIQNSDILDRETII